MVTNLFQPSRNDLLQCSHSDFWSYLDEFNEYSPKNLDIFYEEEFQPPLGSIFYKGEDTIFLKKDTCDEVFQPPYFLSSHYVTKDATRRHVSCLNFSPGKIFFLEFKGRLNALRIIFIS
jgi:hypothetical protein